MGDDEVLWTGRSGPPTIAMPLPRFAAGSRRAPESAELAGLGEIGIAGKRRSHHGDQAARRERLLEERVARQGHAVADDLVVGVAAHVEDLELRPPRLDGVGEL